MAPEHYLVRTGERSYIVIQEEHREAFIESRLLPLIPVPLTKPDRDVLLDLQPMIDYTYRRFRCMRSIDYTQPLSPRLDAAETAWLKQELQARSV